MSRQGPISRRGWELMRMMHAAEMREDWEAAEIVCDGLDCWAGDERTSWRTVMSLLRAMAVKSASEPGSCDRYVLSATGRAALDDPSVIGRVAKALLAGGSFDERGMPLDEPVLAPGAAKRHHSG